MLHAGIKRFAYGVQISILIVLGGFNLLATNVTTINLSLKYKRCCL